MKFTEIPRFTKRPTYHVDINLDYLQDWLEHQGEIGLQLIPDFQRGHVWTANQKSAYVEYLLRGGTSGRELYFNRVGGMHDFSDIKADFVCVDGLQRISACLGFLNEVVPAFGQYVRDFEQPLRFADVNFSININDLSTKKDVLIWYLEMNSGGTPHTEEELERVRKML